MNSDSNPSQLSAMAGSRTLWSVLAVPAGMLLMSAAQLMAARQGLFYKLVLLASAILMLTGAVSFALIEGA